MARLAARRSLTEVYRRASTASEGPPDARRSSMTLAGLAAALTGLAGGSTAWAAAAPPPPPQPAPAAGQASASKNDATAQWRVLTDVGRDLARHGRHADAEPYFSRAVDAARRGFGPRDPHVASACQNLAELYRLQRRYDEAAALYESALAILAEAYGPRDVRVAFALHNVAGLHFARRQYDQAAERYEEALQVKEATVGPGHSETTNTVYHLSEVRWAQGRRAEAIRLASRSLEALEQQGTGEAACARRRARLAEMLMDVGAHAEAEPLLRRVLGGTEGCGGEGEAASAASAASAAESLARAVQGQGRYAEARELLQRALAGRRRRAQAGGSHPATAGTLRRIAQLEVAALEAGQERRPAEVAHAQLRAAEASSEAVSIAEQAYVAAAAGTSSAPAQQQGPPEERGWLSKLWPKAGQPPAALQRPLRPDVAALELANCLRVAAVVQQAVGEAQQAAGLLQRALALLEDAWPNSPPQQAGSAHGAKMEALRQQALCAVLRSMLGVTQVLHGGQSAEAVKRRLAEDGCSTEAR